ncbi:MAG: DUF3786 domain-containing protein [Desulfobacterales bacterium]
MALSVVDIYRKILPKTNCGDCAHPTCLAFASMVVSQKLPLRNCPHIDAEALALYQPELDQQHAAGKWTQRDMAADALKWAKERSTSMDISQLPQRIGGTLTESNEGPVLMLPYFSDTLRIGPTGIFKSDDSPLTRWEQVLIYNHLAQGGSASPGQDWRGLEQIPNTISKQKSMRTHVEQPLVERFRGRPDALRQAAEAMGAQPLDRPPASADVALLFRPLPRIPVVLLFWDHEPEDQLDAQVKLLFDATITEHLDIESILFLSERIKQLLVGE